MLIDARSSSEVRIAIVNESKLETYQVEVAESGLTRGNIYRGVIANLEPSLNAAFVDYGAERNGFLAGPDVVPEARYLTPPKGGRPKINEILEPGRPIVVQVTRDPIGQKGAALTTNLSLAGRNIVLTPFDDMLGVSRKVNNDDDRKKLKALVSRLEMPKGCGAIVRTNAREQNITTLRRDLSALKRLWKNIQGQARQGDGARLLYSDQDLILRALRDLLDNTIEEVLVDSPEALEKAQDYITSFMPKSKTTLKLYAEPFPIFTNYGVEETDRLHLLAKSGTPKRWIDRHRPHRGSNRHRRELRPIKVRQNPRRYRRDYEYRGCRGSGSPTSVAGYRWTVGSGFHRHEEPKVPAASYQSSQRCHEDGSGKVPNRSVEYQRTSRNQSATNSAEPWGSYPSLLPHLRRFRSPSKNGTGQFESHAQNRQPSFCRAVGEGPD